MAIASHILVDKALPVINSPDVPRHYFQMKWLQDVPLDSISCDTPKAGKGREPMVRGGAHEILRDLVAGSERTQRDGYRPKI